MMPRRSTPATPLESAVDAVLSIWPDQPIPLEDAMMKTIHETKVDAIATSYAECIQSGFYTPAEAESQVRRNAPDSGCDSFQIAEGISRGKRWVESDVVASR